jgi:hypothetical protein
LAEATLSDQFVLKLLDILQFLYFGERFAFMPAIASCQSSTLKLQNWTVFVKCVNQT